MATPPTTGFRPDCGQIAARLRPDSGQIAARLRPDCGQIAARFRPDSGQIPARLRFRLQGGICVRARTWSLSRDEMNNRFPARFRPDCGQIAARFRLRLHSPGTPKPPPPSSQGELPGTPPERSPPPLPGGPWENSPGLSRILKPPPRSSFTGSAEVAKPPKIWKELPKSPHVRPAPTPHPGGGAT